MMFKSSYLKMIALLAFTNASMLTVDLRPLSSQHVPTTPPPPPSPPPLPAPKYI